MATNLSMEMAYAISDLIDAKMEAENGNGYSGYNEKQAIKHVADCLDLLLKNLLVAKVDKFLV